MAFSWNIFVDNHWKPQQWNSLMLYAINKKSSKTASFVQMALTYAQI